MLQLHENMNAHRWLPIVFALSTLHLPAGAGVTSAMGFADAAVPTTFTIPASSDASTLVPPTLSCVTNVSYAGVPLPGLIGLVTYSEYGQYVVPNIQIDLDALHGFVKKSGALDNVPAGVDPDNPDWDHPFWIGIATFALIHEGLHSEGACGPADDPCVHIAIAIATTEAACDLVKDLKACKADPECPHPNAFPGDDEGKLTNDGDVQDMIDGLCAGMKAGQKKNNSDDGKKAAMDCVCGGNASPGSSPNCPTIELPTGVGCGDPPPSGAWPVPDCSEC